MSFAVPASLRHVPLHEIAPGTRLYRNHAIGFPGASFNPCKGAPTRFAPLTDPDGACIPSLYAATSFDGAAYETIFRGIPSPYAAIPRQDLDQRGVSVIRPARPLRLVPFFSPELKGWKIDPEQVFRAAASVYPDCRALAALAWREFEKADGIVWASIRDSSARALLLFGDRIAPGDFDAEPPRSLASDPALLDDFIRAGDRAGFRIAR